MLPPGRHAATVDEVHAAFVEPFAGSTSRASIFAGWTLHRESLRNLIPGRAQWIDGSFVTGKVDPGDIDVVTLFDAAEFDVLPEWKRMLAHSLLVGPDNKKFWGVDSYPIPVVAPTDPRYATYAEAQEYWHDLWSQVRGLDTRKKGYLEVAL
jgi:hypothetical protein